MVPLWSMRRRNTVPNVQLRASLGNVQLHVGPGASDWMRPAERWPAALAGMPGAGEPSRLRTCTISASASGGNAVTCGFSGCLTAWSKRSVSLPCHFLAALDGRQPVEGRLSEPVGRRPSSPPRGRLGRRPLGVAAQPC
jgi:hypothetical protein